MSDLISRKAAINAMRKLHADDADIYGAEIPECFDDKKAINALETLPTIQPAPMIRCKDCKWWDDSPLSTVAPEYHRCKIFRKDTLPYFYCGYAERGTDAE